MRLLFILLSVLLVAGFLGLVLVNPGSKVNQLTVWHTTYFDVSLHWVVFGALLAGIVYAGIIGIAQGVQGWVTNRRLTRELMRLETELNYLRTQPPAAEGSSTAVKTSTAPAEGVAGRNSLTPPSAPVYGPDEDDPHPDDDVYSGGRAV